MPHPTRPLILADEPILWTMLMHAAHESCLDAVHNNPELARYVAHWGREGDMGVVAYWNEGGNEMAIAAAWLRLWSENDRGYGYVDEVTPELAMAVLPEYRAQGIGTAMLNQLIVMVQDHFSAMSLSVRSDNPALRLYQRAGFVKLDGSDKANRVGGVSFTMRRSLP